MKKLIYFLTISSFIACKKDKTTDADSQKNYTCECETKTEFIDNCRVDSSYATQTMLAASRSDAEESCKKANATLSNSETKTIKKCELK